jgi:hypothetical protein
VLCNQVAEDRQRSGVQGQQLPCQNGPCQAGRRFAFVSVYKLVYIFHNLRSLKHLSSAEDELNRLEVDAKSAMELFEDDSDESGCSDDDL